MERSFAATLVNNLAEAVHSLYLYGEECPEYKKCQENIRKAIADLIQALTASNPQEEEFPTVRDQFAMAAKPWNDRTTAEMKSEWTGIPLPTSDPSPMAWIRFFADTEAAWRFMQADAMMAARKGAR